MQVHCITDCLFCSKITLNKNKHEQLKNSGRTYQNRKYRRNQ